jgi:hypothetical protein
MVDFGPKPIISGAELAEEIQPDIPIIDFSPKPEPAITVPEGITPSEQAKKDKLERESIINFAPTPEKGLRPVIEHREKEAEINSKVNEFPATKRFLEKENNAVKAQDEIDNLTFIEQIGRAFTHGRSQTELGEEYTRLRDIGSTPERQARIEELEQELLATGGGPDGFVSFVTSTSEVLGQMYEMLASEETGELVAGGALLGGGLGLIAPPAAPVTAIAGAFTGLQASFVVKAYAVEGGLSYGDLLKQGADKDEALVLSHMVGVINAGLETVSFGVITRPIKNVAFKGMRPGIRKAMSSAPMRNIAKQFIKAYGANIFVEVLTENLQELTQIAAEEFAKIGTDKEAITGEALTNRLMEISEKTFKAMVLLAPIGPGIQATVEIKQVRQAKADRIGLDMLREKVAEGGLQALDSVASAEHLAGVLTDVGHAEIFIPGEKLQEWVDKTGDTAVIDALGVQEQMEEATVSGGDVVISADKFAEHIVQSENYDTIVPHVRMGEDVLTEFEALELEESGVNAEIEAVNLEEIAEEREARPSKEIEEDLIEEREADKTFKIKKKPLSDEALKSFESVSDTQRGKPETVMREVLGSRILPELDNVLEHIGDLTHVLTNEAEFGSFRRERVRSKIAGRVQTLENPNLDAFLERNLETASRHQGVPVEVLRERSNKLLQQYADEHRKVPVFNRPQKLARDAAVAVGEKRFKEAAKLLRQLDKIAEDVEGFNIAASAFKPEPLGPTPDLPSAEANEIMLAETSLGLQALFRSANEAGMTEKQYEAYLAKREKVLNTAQKKQAKKRLKDEEEKVTATYKKEEDQVREEERERLNGEQVYQAFNGIQQNRLNKQQVHDALLEIDPTGETKIGDLPTQTRGRKIYATKKTEPAIDLDAHAGLYGYESGAEMIQDFLTSPSFSEVLQERTKTTMEARHGSLADARRGFVEARKTLHETDYGSVLADEMNALRKLRKERKLDASVVKRAARERIKQLPISKISATRFEAAERRNGRKAGIAVRKGELTEAADFKLKQLLNHYMAQEAYKTKDVAKKRVQDIKKKSKYLEKGEKLPTLFQAAILEVTSAVNLRPRLSKKRRAALIELSQRKDDRANIPKYLLDEDIKPNWNDMTSEELAELHETVRDIHHKGLEENKLRSKHEIRERDIVVAFVSDAIRTHLKPIRAKEDRTRWENSKRFGSHAMILLYNADTLLLELDGFESLGPVYSNIKGRYDRALSEGYRPEQIGYLLRAKKEAETLLGLYSAYSKKERKAFNKKLQVKGVHRKLTRQEIIAVLLNTGNQQNHDALIESEQFTEEEIDAVWDFADEKDMLFAQAAIDHLESFWPEVKAAEQSRRNYTPRRIEATPRETKFGVFRGGYYPLRYDNKDSLVPRNIDLEALHAQAQFGSFISHHTARGHTEARKGSSGQKVLLDIFTLNSHVDQVIYDLEVGDAVTDIWKILSHPDIKKAFSDQGHPHKFDWLELWTRDVTTEQVFLNNIVERSLRWIRSGYTISKLGLNIGVALLQPLGILQSSVALGHKNMLWALKAVLTGKQTGENSIYNFVKNETGGMAVRSESYNKDITESQRQLKFGFLDRVTPGNTAKWIRNSYFWMIKTTQGFTDTVTYLAAKRQGMEKFNGDELQAKRFGERSVVRSQASGIFGERTAIERGSIDKRLGQTEMVRGFSVFISYFMAKTNVAIAQTKKTDFKNPAQGLRWTRDMLMLYTVEAMLAAFILNRLDDEEPFLSNVVNETLNVILAGIPFLREISSEVQGFRGGGVPAAIARDFGRAWNQVAEGVVDSELFITLNNVLGVLLHYPAAQIGKSLRAITGEIENEDIAATDFLLGPKFKGK